MLSPNLCTCFLRLTSLPQCGWSCPGARILVQKGPGYLRSTAQLPATHQGQRYSQRISFGCPVSALSSRWERSYIRATGEGANAGRALGVAANQGPGARRGPGGKALRLLGIPRGCSSQPHPLRGPGPAHPSSGCQPAQANTS